MSNTTPTLKIIIGLAIIGVIGFFIGNLLSDSSDENEVVTTESTGAREEMATSDSDTMMENTEEIDAMEEVEEATVVDNTSIVESVATPGSYTAYNPSLLANAEDGAVLLFFHASWCPSCRGLENDIEANLEDIPSDVTILKVNYDTETELRKKYGVVRQHTLVRVDENGKKIETLTGLTNTLDQVLAQI